MILNNTGYTGIDDVLIITRLMVQVESMQSSPAQKHNMTNPVLPWDSFLINLLNATGGSFNLLVEDPMYVGGKKSVSISYPTSAEMIELRLTTLLLGGPYTESCGKANTSFCANPVAVRQLGGSNVFAIFFVEEMLDANVSLSLDTQMLIDFRSKQYKNRTNDILSVSSDITYCTFDLNWKPLN